MANISIYQNDLMPKISSPFENAAMAAQIQQGQNQNRLAQRQFQEADRADMERNALAGIARQYGNTPEYANRLMEGGFVKQAQDHEKYALDRDTSQAELKNKQLTGRKAQIENAMQTLSATEQIMNGVRDQASYEAVLPQLRALHDPETAAKIPTVFDPAAIERGRAQAMPLKERMAQEWKKLEYELNTDKFKYQQGNDAANRGVTMRGQDISANNAAAGRAVTMRGQDMTDKRAANPVAKQGKPMPAAALRMQQEELDAIATASSINADIGTVEQQIKGGKLNLGPLDNMLAKGRNMAGISNESSRNYATFQSTLEKLRNDSLRLNKGVQTDGDSQRAWNELLTNINDPKVVSQRLSEIKKINKRAANIREMNVENIRNNYGAGPLNTSGYSKQPTALGGDKLPGGWTVKEK